MNQLQRSAILSLPSDSIEYTLARNFCPDADGIALKTLRATKWKKFRDVFINVSLSFKE